MQTSEIILEPSDNDRLAALCGQFDEHLKQIEKRLGVDIASRGQRFTVTGPDASVDAALGVLDALYADTAEHEVDPERVHLALAAASSTAHAVSKDSRIDKAARGPRLRTRQGEVEARGPNQSRYVEAIQDEDLVFAIGPAGTGKTYVAVASAVDALERGEIKRLVLVRPAVEAGERLGFLPGDMAAKVDPYLRPMYDALYEMLGFERVAKLTERNIIEVAPLAFMRGRTLNDSFIILDEAQNTTVEQMKMFLTRIGFGSKAVVTGDITQVDLPNKRSSGLRHAMGVLQGVEGVITVHFDAADVVRHPLVQRIVEAYAENDEGEGG